MQHVLPIEGRNYSVLYYVSKESLVHIFSHCSWIFLQVMAIGQVEVSSGIWLL